MNCHVVLLEETGSTNDYALEMIARGKPVEGTVYLAVNQTSGRGLDGNSWESQPGMNLTFSIVTYPVYLLPELQFYMTKSFSVSLCRVLRSFLGEGIKIKWPNDIYYKDSKIAGMLIQNGIQGNRFIYCVAGVGLNVNQQDFPARIPNPVSMKMVTGIHYNLDHVLASICQEVSLGLRGLETGMTDTLDREYLDALYRFREPAAYRLNGKALQATITGVSRYGHLVLETGDGQVLECDLKEVEFVK